MLHKFAMFRAALENAGVPASLAVLNGGIAHRYTGIFRLDGDVLTNVHLYDKQGGPVPPALRSVVLTDSFCQVVLREGELRMDDSTHDPRVASSPFRGEVQAYHGVPIVDAAGQLVGTLCHFDVQQHTLDDDEFQCLQQAARLLGAHGAHRTTT